MIRNLRTQVAQDHHFPTRRAIRRVLKAPPEGLAAYQAVQHLIEHSHERIVFLSGPAHWLSSRERAAGYRRALHEAGLESHVVFMPDTIFNTGRQAMRSALEKYPDLTAVMGVNDATAVGAVQACQQTGRVVPDDVAVVGFDDVPWAQIHIPPLDELASEPLRSRCPGHRYK